MQSLTAPASVCSRPPRISDARRSRHGPIATGRGGDPAERPFTRPAGTAAGQRSLNNRQLARDYRWQSRLLGCGYYRGTLRARRAGRHAPIRRGRSCSSLVIGGFRCSSRADTVFAHACCGLGNLTAHEQFFERVAAMARWHGGRAAAGAGTGQYFL